MQTSSILSSPAPHMGSGASNKTSNKKQKSHSPNVKFSGAETQIIIKSVAEKTAEKPGWGGRMWSGVKSGVGLLWGGISIVKNYHFFNNLANNFDYLAHRHPDRGGPLRLREIISREFYPQWFNNL